MNGRVKEEVRRCRGERKNGRAKEIVKEEESGRERRGRESERGMSGSRVSED